MAGGTGTRMKSQVPKQFLLLKGIPVLMHTMEVFYRYDSGMRIILVLPGDQLVTWQSLCRKYKFMVRHEIGIGGETRFHSVKNNLADIPDHCLVAIHDGVRPLVSHETLDRCFASALVHGNAIPCIEIPETLRYLDGLVSRQVDRSTYRLIQTPQVFDSGILKKAYMQEYQPDFTDDAGVVENLGFTIKLVEGNPENIKITWNKDLLIAASFIKSSVR